MTAFFMAWGMFWIVPCPLKKWNSDKMQDMLCFMPVIGLFIGALWTLLALFLNSDIFGYEPLGIFGAVLLGIFPWIFSGFMHLDGYMDCFDAVLSRRDRARRLEILKDSHVGAFGVIAMIILSLLTVGAFADINLAGKEWILLFIPAVSRACSAVFALWWRPLSTSSYVKMHETGCGITQKVIAIAALLLLIDFCWLFLGSLALCLVAGVVSYALIALSLIKNLGGMSGDIAGCALTISELIAVATLMAF